MGRKTFKEFLESRKKLDSSCKHCKNTYSERSGAKYICTACKNVYYLGERK